MMTSIWMKHFDQLAGVAFIYHWEFGFCFSLVWKSWYEPVWILSVLYISQSMFANYLFRRTMKTLKHLVEYKLYNDDVHTFLC